MAGLELDVATHPIAGNHHIITAAVDFRPQQIDVPEALAPKAFHELGNERMLEKLSRSVDSRLWLSSNTG